MHITLIENNTYVVEYVCVQIYDLSERMEHAFIVSFISLSKQYL